MSKNTLLSELINYVSANSSGNVTIAAPSSGYALDVSGTGRFTGAFGTSSGLYLSGTTYGMYGANRGATNASAGINYFSVGTQKWFSGIYENTDNFGFYSVGTNGFPLVLNYSSGAAVFSSSVNATSYSASGTESFRTYQDNGYISFFNSANTTRQGYLQVQSTALTLSAEGGSAFMAFNTGGGSEKMRITSGGSVGIGTTSPADKLDVAAEAVFGPQTERLSMGSASIGFNRRVSTGVIYDSARFAYQFQHTGSTTNTSDYLALQVYSTAGSQVTPTALVINGLANIGIGTSSPSGRLHIINASGSGQPALELQQSNANSNILQWKGSAGNYLGIISDSGLVGIGTTSPNSTLAISISAFSNAGLKSYTTDNTGGISAYVNSQDPYTGYLDIYATRSGNDGTLGGSVIRFLNQTTSSTANAIERMRIAADGRVGVGTAAPPEPLSVSFAAHGLISQHRQSSGVGVGQNFYMKFNTANGTAAAYAGIYADIQSNTDGAQTGRMILQAANAGSLVSSLIISNNGIITRPMQPLAMGGLVSDQSISATTFTPIAFLTNQGFYGVNTNSCWNNSNYSFTAPVAGTYLVTLSVYTNTVSQIALHVNGVRKHSIPAGYFPAGSNTWGGSAMIPLAAGEVLTLQGYGGGSGVVYQNQYHTWFGIYLM